MESPDLSADLYALVVFLHTRAHRDLFAAIGALELSYSQLELLEYLRGGRRRPTVAQAAAIMHVSAAGASRIVAGLAARGYVTRARDDSDYRARRLEITPRGEAAIAQLHAARHDHICEFASRLEPDEREHLTLALGSVIEREEIAAYRPLGSVSS